VELGRGEHRAGCAPHDLDRLVVGVLPNALVQALGELGGRLDEPRGHEDPALPGEEACLGGRRQLDAPHQVGLPPPALVCARHGAHEVEDAVRAATAAQRVQRPEHAGGADVEVLERQGRLPALPLPGRPERCVVERLLGRFDDRLDRVAHARLAPRRLRERLERAGVEEHGHVAA